MAFRQIQPGLDLFVFHAGIRVFFPGASGHKKKENNQE
jgi:hypothetical protein